MSEKLDIALKNRILEVFENYEDATADAGWELLRQKFPEKKKDRAIVWWYSAAAGLLIFLGLFLLFDNKTENLAYQVHKNVRQEVVVNDSVKKQFGKERSLNLKTEPALRPDHPDNETTDLQNFTYNKPSLNLTSVSGAINSDNIKVQPLGRAPITPLIDANKNITALAGIGNQPSIDQTDKILGIVHLDTIKIVNHNSALNRQAKAQSSVLNNKPADPVLRMMADDKARQASTLVTKEKIDKKESLIAISPYAATYFNYAKGSSNQVNLGAGVTTDFKISGNFKLSTGVAIAQNTLSFDNGSIPQLAANNARASADASVKNSTASGSFTSNTIYSLNNYKANLTGLDIPINFKYQFNPAKSDTYISAGISSGTYINETYSSTAQYSNFFNNTATTTSQVNSNSQHFGTFDFAKTVNFSFGVGYPLGNNRLILEPFLKYPIGGLGSQNLRFGASGINFKFNFSTSKK